MERRQIRFEGFLISIPSTSSQDQLLILRLPILHQTLTYYLNKKAEHYLLLEGDKNQDLLLECWSSTVQR